MFKFLLLHKKVIGAVAIGGVFIASLWLLHNNIYQKGVQDERSRLLSLHNQQLVAQQEEYERRTQEAVELLLEENQIEIERLRQQQQTEIQIEEVVKYVEREVKVPVGCVELSIDIIWMLQQATRAVTDAARDSDTSANQSRLNGVLPTTQAINF